MGTALDLFGVGAGLGLVVLVIIWIRNGELSPKYEPTRKSRPGQFWFVCALFMLFGLATLIQNLIDLFELEI